jgi:cytochrome P450
MMRLSELDLPHLPVEDAAFSQDAVRRFTEAKATHPWLASTNIGYFVHEYTAIKELIADDDRMRPAYDGVVDQLEAHGTPWGRFTEEQMISLPPERHRLLRDTFAAKFTPRFAKQLQPVMRSTIQRLLDDWAPRRKFDFEEFASFFPISVMFALVGAPVEEVAGIRTSLETLGLAFSMDKNRMPAIHEAFDRLEALVERLVSARQADPEGGDPDDLLSLLVKTSEESGIPDRQLKDLIIFFFIAGYDTSKNVLTHTMYILMQHPEIYARCGEDYDYCRRVLDEALRIYSPASIPRFTACDIVYRGVLLPKDTMLWFPLSISGRDPGSFDEPETFDPDRPVTSNSRHIAFSLGRHMCLGQFIARAQLQEALYQIPQRLLEPRLVGPYGWRPFPGIWGLKGLPIAFELPAKGADLRGAGRGAGRNRDAGAVRRH